jgi:hypothetical protein
MNEPKLWNSTQANPTILELARKITEQAKIEFDKWYETKSETWRNTSPYIKYEHMPWDELREILKKEEMKGDRQ